jgi:hypothetical protein
MYLESAGCYLIRNRAKHDIYHNSRDVKLNQYQDIQKLMSD